MVRVQEGYFLMGSQDSDRDQWPQHKVYLDAYWIDQTEVTNAQFQLCMNEGICENPHKT